MEIIEDIKLKQLFISKNISEGRKQIYRQTFEEIYELTKKTPSELLNEALKEQKPQLIENNQIEYKEIHERKVNDYMFLYYDYLSNKKLKEVTIYNKIATLRAFYNHYSVQLPKKIQLNEKQKIIREGDIPNRKDIRKGLNIEPNIRNKAIITLMASSGIRRGDIVKFTVKDFFEAAKEYHDNNIETLFKTKKNVIPCWYFYPSKTAKAGNLCVTFNTPECSEYIIEYLKQRKKANNLNMDDPLFMSKKGNAMDPKTVQWLFSKINRELFGICKDGKGFFRTHTMRKFFITTCNHNSSDIVKVNLLSGHAMVNPSIHNAYNEVNIKVMKRFYTRLIPYLSFSKTKVNIVPDAQIEKLKKEHKKDMEKLETKHEKEIKEIKNDLDEFKDIIENEKAKKEMNEFIKQSYEHKIIQKIMEYVFNNYGLEYLNDINFIRKVNKLNKEEKLKKMKQKEWKKEIDKIVDKIQPVNIDEEFDKMLKNTK